LELSASMICWSWPLAEIWSAVCPVDVNPNLAPTSEVWTVFADVKIEESASWALDSLTLTLLIVFPLFDWVARDRLIAAHTRLLLDGLKPPALLRTRRANR